MAELFLAKRRGVEGFEKIVAIKRILPELSWNREFVSMFINEAKIAARLSHPNIVQIFDFGKIDNYYFIAMEYVHGENLRAIAAARCAEGDSALAGDSPPSSSREPAPASTTRIARVDESGKPLRIVHRDVSPQNVLVSYDGDVKVVDFGIAKAVAENPEATRGVLKGKLAYFHPSRCSGRSLDARSDIFAIGLVLYELLAGKKLFASIGPRGRSRFDRAHRRRGSLSFGCREPDRTLREVLRRALGIDPENVFVPRVKCRWLSRSTCASEGIRAVRCNSPASCACCSMRRWASIRRRSCAPSCWGSGKNASLAVRRARRCGLSRHWGRRARPDLAADRRLRSCARDTRAVVLSRAHPAAPVEPPAVDVASRSRRLRRPRREGTTEPRRAAPGAP